LLRFLLSCFSVALLLPHLRITFALACESRLLKPSTLRVAR
jgi:hypothetical protein